MFRNSRVSRVKARRVCTIILQAEVYENSCCWFLRKKNVSSTMDLYFLEANEAVTRDKYTKSLPTLCLYRFFRWLYVTW